MVVIVAGEEEKETNPKMTGYYLVVRSTAAVLVVVRITLTVSIFFVSSWWLLGMISCSHINGMWYNKCPMTENNIPMGFN